MKRDGKTEEKARSVFSVEPRKDFLVVLLGILFGVAFGWGVMEILIFSLLILSVLRSFPSRIMILPGILFLILAALLLLLDRVPQAEEFSIYAYYFFVIAIILAVIEVRTARAEPGKHENGQG